MAPQELCARGVVIGKAAKFSPARAESFAQTMTLEMGKRISEARGAVEFSARILTYYAQNAVRFLAPVTLHPAQGYAHMQSSPIGVIFARDFCPAYLELSVLSAAARGRAAVDRGQCPGGETCQQRAALRAGV